MYLATLNDLSEFDLWLIKEKTYQSEGIIILKERTHNIPDDNTRINFTDITTSLINFFWIFVIFCKCAKSFSGNLTQSFVKICYWLKICIEKFCYNFVVFLFHYLFQ